MELWPVTKENYLELEAFAIDTAKGWPGHETEMRALLGRLAACWHSLSPQDQAELAARPPVEGRPRFVSSTASLKPTEAGWAAGSVQASLDKEQP